MDDWKRQSGFTLGEWEVVPLLGELRRGGEIHHVEPKVMDVLVFLARQSGEVVERDAIIESVWGGRFVSDDPLSKCIAELRKVLGDSARDSQYIGTVHKRGYRLLQPVAPIATDRVAAAGGTQRWRFGLTAAILVAVLVAATALQMRSPAGNEVPAIAGGQYDARQTLAVLPLVIRSTQAEDAFIGDGLHDDLLTQLARIGDWNVISRTSVERFRGTDEAMADIAGALDATLVLEGGLQRNGRQVRINLQLIDPSGDRHLWAKTYNRELADDNLFDVQSDLVQSIVTELAAVLDVNPPVSPSPTTRNFEAYSEYVKGRRLVRTESVTTLNDAVRHFRTAIEIDPNFAEAHAALADTYLSLALYFFGGMPPDEAILASEPLIKRAIELDPGLAQAYVANANLQMLQHDATAATESIDMALQLQPSYPRAYRVLASLRWRQQRIDEAIELAEHASSLDPLSGVIQLELGRYYEAVARYDGALQNYLVAQNVLPENALVRLYIGALKYLVFGDVAESLQWYRQAAELDPRSPSMQVTPAFAYIDIGDLDRAQECVDRGMALSPSLFWVRLASMTLNLRRGDRQSAINDAVTALKDNPNQRAALRLLRDRDLDDANPQAALRRYAEQHPELTEPEDPRVDSQNYFIAVDAALAYSRLGQQEKAMRLTAEALEVMESLQRMGVQGYWLTDVSALAIRGDHDEALDRLEAAIERGFRIKLWYFFDIEKNLESLHDLPRFRQIRERAFAAMQAETELAHDDR